MLYFPAIAAARFNPDLKKKYEELIAAGKEKKVALTAIMRKIIVMANALIRDGLQPALDQHGYSGFGASDKPRVVHVVILRRLAS